MLFVASIVALLIGPALVQFAERSERVRELVDGFALVAVGGLTLLIVLPNALSAGGMTTLLFVALGLLLPTVLHRVGARALALTADRALIVGVAVHAALECAALAGADGHFGLAVAAHRIPVGLAVFMLVANPSTGWRYIGLLVLVSVGGFLGGQELIGWLSNDQHAWLEGFVAGSLLHVVHGHSLGHSHNHDHKHEHHHEPESSPAQDHDHSHAAPDACGSGAGASADGHSHEVTRTTALGAVGSILGLCLVLAVLIDPHHHHGPYSHAVEPLGNDFIATFIDLALTSAPALLLGYALAGLVRGLISARQLGWLSSPQRGVQALKGVAFGLPLPICSCGVLPLYQTLIRAGVPTTAGVAFLIATPELGIDALLLSLPLLGETLTLLRLVAALAVALGVALLLGYSATPAPTATAVPVTNHEPLQQRVVGGLRFGFVELFDHTMPWIVLGLLIAALLAPLLDASIIASVPAVAQVPLFALLSIPAYVCAAGATPIAAVAIAGGVSPGAALAFLIAGPATNITTFGILTQLHGRRFALRFGAAVAAAAMIAGWSVDLSGLVDAAAAPTIIDHEASRLEQVALIVLAGFACASLFRQGPRGVVQQIIAPFRSVAVPS